MANSEFPGLENIESTAPDTPAQSMDDFLKGSQWRKSDDRELLGRTRTKHGLVLSNVSTLASVAEYDDPSFDAWEKGEARFDRASDRDTRRQVAARIQLARLARSGKLDLFDVTSLGVDNQGRVRVRRRGDAGLEDTGQSIDWSRMVRYERSDLSKAREVTERRSRAAATSDNLLG